MKKRKMGTMTSAASGDLATGDPRQEIADAWSRLEEFGYPPEAVGWPMVSIDGLLPDAIGSALSCVLRQRDDLLNEVMKLRGSPETNA